ncbi:hypothetical protein K1T71_010477 [Dendrolimus kikuchii]|uniref:Uncharacterized protein n=1 Tax=Dendrolimus kikuchii TaxID=765133 RepID=A0ACC1CRP4_9NEOP|nr:hypothetical protein K1T71_010477 [Dendrolimus kikuchii]
MDVDRVIADDLATKAAFQTLTALQLTAYLWPQQAQVYDGDYFDFIVIGAGTAGSVIASRLTEIPDVTVLLVEAGEDPPIQSMLPALNSYMKNTPYNWNITSKKDGYTSQCRKRKYIQLNGGRMLGGSSSINYNVYTRGSVYDYDRMAAAANDSCWNWSGVLPYFKKSEKLTDEKILRSRYGSFHGTDGCMGVKRYYNMATENYLKSFAELDNNIVLDVNGNESMGYTETMFTIANETRQSTAYSFLTKAKDRPNLYLLKNTRVIKITFDGNNVATGVMLLRGDNTTLTVKATKEVILSAGAVYSPQLLMLSGIGPARHLICKRIKVIADLPVGERFQNHVYIIVAIKTHKIKDKPEPPNPHETPLPHISGYVSLDKKLNYPQYQSLNFIINNPTTFLRFCVLNYEFEDEICQSMYDQIDGREIMLTELNLLHPESEGKILLRDKNPLSNPLISVGYYSKKTDLKQHISFLKDFLQVINTTYFKNVKAEMILPKSKCKNLQGDEYWECYALCLMGAEHHYTGTCAMGAVVDNRLKVYSVKNLRVADAGVIPYVIGANTAAAAVMVGEKAADIIKEDHGYITPTRCTK